MDYSSAIFQKKILADARVALFTLILLVTFLCGIVFPLAKMITALPAQSGYYQQSMLHLTNALLQEGGEFLAGIPLFYNRNQTIPGMIHLMGPAIDYLYKPTEKLRPVMQMSALNLIPTTPDKIIQSLAKSKVKLYVNNYRMDGLPSKIKNYLASQYEHFWGSVYVYAPTFTASQKRIEIKFSGKYKLESKAAVMIDNKKIAAGNLLQLTEGAHKVTTKTAYRLKWVPENVEFFLDPRCQADTWERMTN